MFGNISRELFDKVSCTFDSDSLSRVSRNLSNEFRETGTFDSDLLGSFACDLSSEFRETGGLAESAVDADLPIAIARSAGRC